MKNISIYKIKIYIYMKLEFVDIFLIVSMTSLIMLYTYQNNGKCSIKTHSKKSASNNNSKINNDNITHPIIEISNNTTNTNPQKNIMYMPNGNDRKLGPPTNFHNKFMTQKKELGWRNWWSKHKNKNNVPNNTNFTEISTYNFLSGLDNVKNLYI